jgi:hypothetical protein
MKNYFESIDREGLRARADQLLGYADDARNCAVRWTDHAVEKAHGFSVLDFAIWEACLLSLGLWLGSCFGKCLKKLRGALFAVFAASWVYLFWRVFIDDAE